MAYTTVRMRRRNGAGGRLRFWLAVFLALGAGAAAWLVFSRDVDWPARNRDARARGLAAETAGDYPLARARYEAALAANPYDWESRLRLADILNHRLNVRAPALTHYLYALAYSPDPAIVPETEAKIRILTLLRNGELEDPRDAAEDLFAAAESGAKSLFEERLHPRLGENFNKADFAEAGGDAYWNAWRGRGRGVIAFSRVETARDGQYDAVLELEYPDGSAMSMHLRSPLRDVWRLNLSFP